MLPIFRDAPNFNGVAAGGTPTCDYDPGWNYYILRFVCTVSKTAATAVPVVEPTLDEAVQQIVINLNGDPKRTILTHELNSIHRAWQDNVSATLYSKIDNDLKTATVDVVAGGNTTRRSTWVVDVLLAEPTRDSYTARKAFSWPTKWANAAVGNYPANYTANIQAQLTLSDDASLTKDANNTATTPAVRSQMLVDTRLGAIVGNPVAPGSIVPPNTIPYDILALSGIPAGPNTASPVGAPIMPITHWYRWNKNYGSTAVQIRGTEWPFRKGALQQLSMFMPTDQPDYIQDVQVLLNNAFKVKSTKADLEKLQRDWNWSESYGAGTAGIDYPAASVLHLAFDFSDDPSDAIVSNDYSILEMNLTLAQAASANPSMIVVAQFYRNGLLL